MNTIEIDSSAIKIIVRKSDAVIIYTNFGKYFVCTLDNPVTLPDGKIRYILKERD